MALLIRSLTLMLLISLANCGANAETATAQVARQFREYCLHESTDHGERLLDDVELPKTSPNEAAKLCVELKADGSWADVDYASKSRSSWPPCTHLTRALGLVVYARREDTSADESAKCIVAAHRAIAYWQQHDYQCPNWWYNEIGVPKILGNLALLLDQDLNADERTYITGTVLPRSNVGSMTGQNRVWLAANGVMLAALLADENLMRTATGVIQEELRVGTGEGIQPDWSFQQHGPQQQFGNYGMAYAVEMSRWVTVLRGTPWAFPADKAGILRDYLLDGESWVIWRGLMDISACGRQLFPNSPWSKAGVVRGTMRAMAVADTTHAGEYLGFVQRNQPGATNDLIGDRYFWRSDYLIHRRAEFMTTLKMSSDRVIGGETVNSENLSGLHLADGATYFYRSGHEYDDIFPAWDWRLIPGVTCQLDNTSLRWPAADLKRGAEFVGGVSDGTNACAAMNFHRDGLRAKKAWFFLGDTVVCLGADISATGNQPVVTTLNQCLLKTAVTVRRDGKVESLGDAAKNLSGADWVEQDGLRYTRLEPEALQFSATNQTGNWHTVFDSPAAPKADVAKDIFTLWIDHGTNASFGSYAYSVAPAEETVDQEIKILSNSGQVQAVKIGVGKNNFVAAVFWRAGSADLDGTSVKANAPCLLLLNAAHVTVSDPTQKLKTLQLEINGKSTVISLPQGDAAGNSVVSDTF
jgi:chondroitin AC lyase